jgi:hypothetical protein
MKKLLILLTLCTLAFIQPKISEAQDGKNPPPSELTNDQLIQKSIARYQVGENMNDTESIVGISFEYTWTEKGKKNTMLVQVDDYTLYLFQTTPKGRHIWQGSDSYFIGCIPSPPSPEFAVWVLFNDKNPIGNIRTGHLRIR